MLLPVTLSTASVLSLIYLWTILLIGQGRAKHRISIGDGGNADMLVRMRIQANFIEYVPLLLVMMALLEAAGADFRWLAVSGIMLILFRILHVIGMPRPAPNPCRAYGAGGTVLLVLAFAVWGLKIVLMA